MRLLRLVKMLRLLKGSRLLNRYRNYIAIDYTVLTVLQSVPDPYPQCTPTPCTFH